MPTRNISLTERWDSFIEDCVASGDYQNASEVVRHGLRLLMQQQREEAEKLERLRNIAAAGFAQIDRGDSTTILPDAIGSFISEMREEVSGAARARRRVHRA